jgi:hypothetical protein
MDSTAPARRHSMWFPHRFARAAALAEIIDEVTSP